jgi:hypothetical protein
LPPSTEKHCGRTRPAPIGHGLILRRRHLVLRGRERPRNSRGSAGQILLCARIDVHPHLDEPDPDPDPDDQAAPSLWASQRSASWARVGPSGTAGRQPAAKIALALASIASRLAGSASIRA